MVCTIWMMDLFCLYTINKMRLKNWLQLMRKVNLKVEKKYKLKLKEWIHLVPRLFGLKVIMKFVRLLFNLPVAEEILSRSY